MPPQLSDNPQAERILAVVYLNSIDSVAANGVTSTQGAIVSKEASRETVESKPFVGADGAQGRVFVFVRFAPGFYLQHDQSSSIKRDDIGFDRSGVPVVSHCCEPVTLDVSQRRAFSPPSDSVFLVLRNARV